jgi:hypothetical protein
MAVRDRRSTSNDELSDREIKPSSGTSSSGDDIEIGGDLEQRQRAATSCGDIVRRHRAATSSAASSTARRR